MDQLVENSISINDLRILREKLVKLRGKEFSCCVSVETFYYAHDGHIGEQITIWDDSLCKHFYFSNLSDAVDWAKNLLKGE